MIRSKSVMRIALVPAKGKSKRFPNKNWRTFTLGQSLAEKKFLYAIACGNFDHTVLTTDLDKLPFLKARENAYALKTCHPWSVRHRPRFLKDDSVAVALDALDTVCAQDEDVYCLLQPTSPMLMPESITKAMRGFQAHRSAIVSVTPAYKPSGGFYIGTVGNLRRYESFFQPLVTPYVLNWAECVDIDYDYDFYIAQGILE